MPVFIANLCPLTTFVVYQLVLSYRKCSNIVFLTDLVIFSPPAIISSGLRSPAVRNTLYAFTLRSVVDYYVNHGSTVNICALDISKAFDKMNHHGLFLKLM